MEHRNVDLLDELHRLLAEEVEAFLRYFHLRYRLRGAERLAAERFFEQARQETIEHAEAIATKIRALGDTPRLDITLSLSGGPLRLQEALAEALEFEREALDAYTEFLPRVTGNPFLEDFIRQQIAVETEHVQDIATLLE